MGLYSNKRKFFEYNLNYMSINQQTIAVIRQRGQLTIPDSLRKQVSWAKSNMVISISINNINELILKPYSVEKKTGKAYWKEIWGQLELCRSLKGKRGNLSQFIVEDREKH